MRAPKTKKNLEKGKLEILYLEKKKSLQEISEILNVALVTVHRYMKRYNIKIRPNHGGEWTEERRKIVSDKAKEYMKGNKNSQQHINYIYKSRTSAILRTKEIKGDKCQVCGWNEGTCDGHHLIPTRSGGKNQINNILIICPNHHRLLHEGKIKESDIIGNNH